MSKPEGIRAGDIDLGVDEDTAHAQNRYLHDAAFQKFVRIAKELLHCTPTDLRQAALVMEAEKRSADLARSHMGAAPR